MNKLETTKIIPDYSKSNEELWEEVCNLPAFSKSYLDKNVLKNAPRLNFKSVDIALIKPGIHIEAGQVKEELKKENLSEIDFPTFCKTLKENQDYFKENYLVFEWSVGYTVCYQSYLYVDCNFSGGWPDYCLFLGASKIST